MMPGSTGLKAVQWLLLHTLASDFQREAEQSLNINPQPNFKDAQSKDLG